MRGTRRTDQRPAVRHGMAPRKIRPSVRAESVRSRMPRRHLWNGPGTPTRARAWGTRDPRRRRHGGAALNPKSAGGGTRKSGRSAFPVGPGYRLRKPHADMESQVQPWNDCPGQTPAKSFEALRSLVSSAKGRKAGHRRLQLFVCPVRPVGRLHRSRDLGPPWWMSAGHRSARIPVAARAMGLAGGCRGAGMPRTPRR